MPTLADAPTRAAVLARLARLTPDATPAWGRMTAPQVLAHLTDAFRMAFGELPCAPRHVAVARTFPMKHLLLYVLPMPKGVPTAPELLARTATDWEAEHAHCAALIGRFDAPPAAWPEHPFFGPLTGAQWGRLAYKHTDHHLRQFGV